MLTQQSFTIEGKPKDKTGSFIFDKNGLFVIVSFSETGDTPLKPLAKTIWENAQKIPFVKPIEQLREFLKNLNQLSTDVKIEILIGKRINNDIFYAGILGKFFLFLKRKGETVSLFGPTTATKTVSGFLKTNDLLIAATDEGRKILDAEAEIPPDLTTFTQQLSEKVHAEESGQAAIMFWQIISQDEPTIEPTVVQSDASLSVSSPSKFKLPQVLPILSFFTRTVAKINLKIIKFLAGLFILAVVGVIGFNVVLGYAKHARAKVEAEIKKVTEISRKLDSAKELLNLNNMRSGELARQALEEIKNIDINKLAASGNRKKLEDLRSQLEKTVKEASNVVETKAQPVYATTLLKKNSLASQIVINGNRAEILDAKQNLVYDVDLVTKKAEAFDIGKYAKSPLFLTLYNDYIFVLDSEGIVQIQAVDKKIKTTLKKDKEWGNMADFTNYSGNLYLLDIGASQIWKYSKEDGGFSTIKKYFTAAPDLKKAVSFSIDSAVYILFKDGKISKYLSGEPHEFNVKVPNSSLKNPIKIVTNDVLDNVYVLEPSAKRIIILDKKGKYVAQVVDNKLAGTRAFGVNEKTKTIFFAVGAEIYKINY